MISPMGKGDTAPLLEASFIDDEGAVFSLAGLTAAALTLWIVQGSSTPVQGQGTFTIVNAAGGVNADGSYIVQATYAWNTADTSVSGARLIFIIVQTTNGPQHFDAQPQLILPY